MGTFLAEVTEERYIQPLVTNRGAVNLGAGRVPSEQGESSRMRSRVMENPIGLCEPR